MMQVKINNQTRFLVNGDGAWVHVGDLVANLTQAADEIPDATTSANVREVANMISRTLASAGK